MRKLIFISKFNPLTGLMVLVVAISITTVSVVCKNIISSNSLHAANFFDRSLQNELEELVAKKLRGRNLLISINSQLYYSLFKKSFAENSQVIVGKHEQLFELSYITAYCRNSQRNLVAWADNLSEMNKYFVKQGKVFLYLITPSKAEYIPEAIPARFNCARTGMSPHLFELEKLLQDRKIPYINGSALMLNNANQFAVPLFPQGGIHWNALGATLAADQIIASLNEKLTRSLSSISYAYHLTQVNHQSSDDDLLSLLKLAKPNRNYQVPVMNFSPSKQHPNMAITIVGGSFNENLINMFLANQTFRQIDFYFYLRVHKRYEFKNLVLRNNIESEKVPLKKMMAADIIILEENASITHSAHGQKLFSAVQNASALNS